jgi:SAM-dependent methyltransferase
MSDRAPHYLFGGDEDARIHAAEELCDEGSVRVLSRLGIGLGARCLEVGAGGGLIAGWLCDLVGESGTVVATDIDVRPLEARGRRSQLEIRRHDIVGDDLEEGRFDLVHARLFLEHLPARDLVLEKLIGSLRPGGWIVLESVDHVSAVPVSEVGASEHAHTQSVRMEEFAKNGIAHDLGRELPARLRANGLVDVGNEGRVWVMEGGSPGARWFGLSLAHLRARLVGTGRLTDLGIDRMLQLFSDPEWAALSPVILAAWGRRPV